MKGVFTVIFVFLCFTFSFGQDTSKLDEEIKKNADNNKSISAVKAESAIQIDGYLNEPVYSTPPITNFTQKDPNEGEPASQKTHVWIFYDESNIYVGAKLFDTEPDKIDAGLTRRDNYIESDWFSVYFDSYNDKTTGYYFGVNAGGSFIDGTMYNDSWDDDSWDGVWAKKARLVEDGWIVEMRIPFTQVRFREEENMTWGINFQRRIKRNSERDYYAFIPKSESGFVSHFADLTNIKGVKPKQRIEVMPYMVQKAQYLRNTDGPFYKKNQYQTTFGADFKIGLGSNFNLDGTIFPDFGQVEIDPAQLNLGAGEIFYREKRPFFIEGSNIFNFGSIGSNSFWGFNFGNMDLFYTRRIGSTPSISPGAYQDYDYADRPIESSILGAAKITGKIDETWSVGALTSVTQEETAAISYLDDASGNTIHQDVIVEPTTHYGAIRSLKELNDGKQAVGFQFTSVNRDLSTTQAKDLLAQNAYTFGVDAYTFLDDDEEYVITGYAVGSYTHGSKEYMDNVQNKYYRYFKRPDVQHGLYDPNRTSMAGYYSRIMLNKQKGNFFLNSALGVVSPGFEASDLGSQWMADRQNFHVVAGWKDWEPDGTFRYKRYQLGFYRNFNFDGNMIGSGFNTNLNFTFENYYSIEMGAGYYFEDYSFTKLRGGPLAKSPEGTWIDIWAETDSRMDVIHGISGSYSQSAMGGYYWRTVYGIDWRPNSQINLSFEIDYSFDHSKDQWVGSFEDPLALHTYGSRYVFGEIDRQTIAGEIRLNWTFTPELTLQLYLQPYFSIGEYTDYKEFSTPGQMDYMNYGTNGSTITYDADNDEYSVDPDGNGNAESFTFSNPDFNFKSLRANIVLRWEVMPGSVFYLVWSHDRVNSANPGNFRFGRDFSDLWQSNGDNIFLVKFNYWLDVMN